MERKGGYLGHLSQIRQQIPLKSPMRKWDRSAVFTVFTVFIDFTFLKVLNRITFNNQ